jgi:predicted nucleic acid-binding protein
VNDFVLDASVALQWFLEDEADRKYSLAALAKLSENRAMVPILWFYEVGNGLLMAHRCKRITLDQLEEFVTRLKALSIESVQQTPATILEIPSLASVHGLTNYDAAYLSLALKLGLPLAATDSELRQSAAAAGVKMLAV